MKLHRIRTAGLTDDYLARAYRVSRETVRLARIGETWKNHKTPPDTRPRLSPGRHTNGVAVIVETGPTQINEALRMWRGAGNGEAKP